MKPWIYKHLLVLVLVGLGSATTFAADGQEEFTKTIKKEFEISKNGKIGISNQFGKIEINTWNKDKAKFSIVISVRTSSEDRAQEIFDRIDVDFSSGSDYVKAVTEIESQKSKWGWNGWNGNNNADFAINYEVYLPKTVALDIQNRHGNTFIAEMSGNAELDIAHGNITADGFTGSLEFEMAHGNGTVIMANSLDADISHSNIRFKTLGNVQLETAHCQIDLGNAKKIRLDSRHTNFEMGTIEELRVDSRHDHFEIDAAKSIFSESQHSTYEIDKLSIAADFDCQHGGAFIDYLEKGFDEIILSGSHAGFKIRMDESAAFDLDAYASHAGIRYPMDMNVSYEKDKNNAHEVRGKRGGSGNAGKIRARLAHGSLRIR